MTRTTIVLPDDLHERLRREAFTRRVSLSHLIRSRLEQPRKKRASGIDPLLEVAGIFSGDGKLSEGIDEALYGDERP